MMATLIEQMDDYIPQMRGERGRWMSTPAKMERAMGRVANPTAPLGAHTLGMQAGATPFDAGLPYGGMDVVPTGRGWTSDVGVQSRPSRALVPTGRGFGPTGRYSTPTGPPGPGLMDQMGFRNPMRPLSFSAPGSPTNWANRTLARPGVAGLLRGTGYGLAGTVAGGALAEPLYNMEGEILGADPGVLGDAVRWGGIGAGIGAPLGIPGALIGGGIGAIGGALFGNEGGDRRSMTERINEEWAGMVPEPELRQAEATYNALREVMEHEDAFNAAYGEIVQRLAQGGNQPAPDVLALQMASQAVMQPIINQSRRRMQTFENMMTDQIANLPEEYRPIYSASIPEMRMWQEQMLDANTLAAQMAPVAEAMRQQTGTQQGYGNILAEDPLLSEFVGG